MNGSAPATKTESFQSPAVSLLNGWSYFGNRENRNSYAYSQSNYTNSPEGLGWEAGGIFARASTTLGETTAIPVSYYADTRLGGGFTLDDPIHANGELNVIDSDQWDNNVHIGYFDRSDAESNQHRNVLGLVINEPAAHLGSVGIRAAAYIKLASGPEIFGGWVNAPTGLDFNVPYTWRYTYDPDGGVNGAGQLLVEVLSSGISLGTSQIDLTTAQRETGATFDAFGLKTGGNSPKSNSPNTVSLYVDEMTYSRPVGNIVQGNIIGLADDETSPVPNGTGVLIIGAPDNVFRSNVISGNVGTGIDIRGNAATGNRIQGNSIHDNGGLGIDLGGDGLTANDRSDEDTGPNHLQNFPELRAARAGSTTTVIGTLNSRPSATFTLDFYASEHLDSNGFGEGARWLGSIDVTTNQAGIASFREGFPVPTEGGEFITATATDGTGNTSEFSAGVMTTGRNRDGVLVIGGTIGNDVVQIASGSIDVTINGERFIFDDDGIGLVDVNLLSGDDKTELRLPDDSRELPSWDLSATSVEDWSIDSSDRSSTEYTVTVHADNTLLSVYDPRLGIELLVTVDPETQRATLRNGGRATLFR